MKYTVHYMAKKPKKCLVNLEGVCIHDALLNMNVTRHILHADLMQKHH